MREGGGTVYNTLKGGGTKKRGGYTKILKIGGGKVGQGVSALKGGGGGGLEPPCELCYNNINFLFFFFTLRTFQRNLKEQMVFDYNDFNFNA